MASLSVGPVPMSAKSAENSLSGKSPFVEKTSQAERELYTMLAKILIKFD